MNIMDAITLTPGDRVMVVVCYGLHLMEQQGLSVGSMNATEDGIKIAKMLLADGWRPTDASIMIALTHLRDTGRISDGLPDYLTLIRKLL